MRPQIRHGIGVGQRVAGIDGGGVRGLVDPQVGLQKDVDGGIGAFVEPGRRAGIRLRLGNVDECDVLVRRRCRQDQRRGRGAGGQADRVVIARHGLRRTGNDGTAPVAAESVLRIVDHIEARGHHVAHAHATDLGGREVLDGDLESHAAAANDLQAIDERSTGIDLLADRQVRCVDGGIEGIAGLFAGSNFDRHRAAQHRIACLGRGVDGKRDDVIAGRQVGVGVAGHDLGTPAGRTGPARPAGGGEGKPRRKAVEHRNIGDRRFRRGRGHGDRVVELCPSGGAGRAGQVDFNGLRYRRQEDRQGNSQKLRDQCGGAEARKTTRPGGRLIHASLFVVGG